MPKRFTNAEVAFWNRLEGEIQVEKAEEKAERKQRMLDDPTMRIHNLRPIQLKEILRLYLQKHGSQIMEDSGMLEKSQEEFYTSMKLRQKTMDKITYCCLKDDVNRSFMVDLLIDAYMQSKGYILTGSDSTKV